MTKKKTAPTATLKGWTAIAKFMGTTPASPGIVEGFAFGLTPLHVGIVKEFREIGMAFN